MRVCWLIFFVMLGFRVDMVVIILVMIRGRIIIFNMFMNSFFGNLISIIVVVFFFGLMMWFMGLLIIVLIEKLMIVLIISKIRRRFCFRFERNFG